MKLDDLCSAMESVNIYDTVSRTDLKALKKLSVPARMEELDKERVWDEKRRSFYLQAALPYRDRGGEDRWGGFRDWNDVVRVVSFRLFPEEEIEDPVVRSHRFNFNPQNSPLLAQVAGRLAKEYSITYRPYAPPKMIGTTASGIVDLTYDPNYSHFRRGLSQVAEFVEAKNAVDKATSYMERIIEKECQRLYQLGEK